MFNWRFGGYPDRLGSGCATGRGEGGNGVKKERNDHWSLEKKERGEEQGREDGARFQRAEAFYKLSLLKPPFHHMAIVPRDCHFRTRSALGIAPGSRDDQRSTAVSTAHWWLVPHESHSECPNRERDRGGQDTTTDDRKGACAYRSHITNPDSLKGGG